MKKNIAFTLILIIPFLLLYGCGKSKGESSQSFDSTSMREIIIDAGDHPVLLVDAPGEEITLSLGEEVKQIGMIEEQSLKIKLPPQSGIINIIKPSKLVVGIPDDWNGSVDVTSESGTAQAENVSLQYLAFKSDSGDIVLKNVSDSGTVLLSNISGTVSAKTDSGRIRVPSNMADQVKPGDMNLGEVLEAQIDSTDRGNIKVYTNSGNIKIN